MRYFLFESGESKLLLSKEMKYLQSNIDLQTLGFGIDINNSAGLLCPFKNQGSSIGTKRYSTVECLTTGNSYLIGTDRKLLPNIECNAGLNQLYPGNGEKLGKHLTLGLTTALLSGFVHRQEEVITSASDGINIEKNLF